MYTIFISYLAARSLPLLRLSSKLMALSSSSSSNSSPIVSLSPFSRPNFFYPSNVSFFHFPIKLNNSVNFNYTNNVNVLSASEKWRPNVSFSFPFFLKKGKDVRVLKEELLEAIASLDRGAEASSEDQQRVDEVIALSYIFFVLS